MTITFTLTATLHQVLNELCTGQGDQERTVLWPRPDLADKMVCTAASSGTGSSDSSGTAVKFNRQLSVHNAHDSKHISSSNSTSVHGDRQTSNNANPDSSISAATPFDTCYYVDHEGYLLQLQLTDSEKAYIKYAYNSKHNIVDTAPPQDTTPSAETTPVQDAPWFANLISEVRLVSNQELEKVSRHDSMCPTRKEGTC